jgi:hypothetical protein
LNTPKSWFAYALHQHSPNNEGYAISVARKLGAEIFLLPHDIVEVR